MDMRKFTEKSIAAVQSAQSTAREYGNPEIAQVHLLHALLTADEGLIGQLVTKMGKSPTEMTAETKREIERLPKTQGGEQYIAAALKTALDEAESQAKKMGDSFLSVEHLFYGWHCSSL